MFPVQVVKLVQHCEVADITSILEYLKRKINQNHTFLARIRVIKFNNTAHSIAKSVHDHRTINQLPNRYLIIQLKTN